MYKEKIDLQGFETPFEMIRTKYSSRFQIIERRFVHFFCKIKWGVFSLWSFGIHGDDDHTVRSIP